MTFLNDLDAEIQVSSYSRSVVIDQVSSQVNVTIKLRDNHHASLLFSHDQGRDYRVSYPRDKIFPLK